MYIVVNSLIHSLSLTHSEHWAVSSMYFLLWVAVQSLHLAASSACILLLHLWSPDQNHWLQLGPESNADSQASPQTHWIRTCISVRSPGDSYACESMRSPVLEAACPCATSVLVLFLWLLAFLLAGSHLLKLSFVLPPAVLSFPVKWKGWWNRQPEVQRDGLARFRWRSYIWG